MSLLGPLLPATIGGRWAHILLAGKVSTIASTNSALTSKRANTSLDGTSSFRMLSNSSPEQMTSSKYDLEPRFRRSSASSKMHSETAATAVAIKANGLGNRDGKLTNHPLSWRGHFAAIESSGKNQDLNDFSLCISVPWHSLELVAETNGLGNPVVEGGSTKRGPNIKLPSKVTNRD